MTILPDFNDRDISDPQVSPVLPSYFLASTGDNLAPNLTTSSHTDGMEIFLRYPNDLNDILTAALTGHKLNSLIPIFELLGPKFVLDQNAYVSFTISIDR